MKKAGGKRGVRLPTSQPLEETIADSHPLDGMTDLQHLPGEQKENQFCQMRLSFHIAPSKLFNTIRFHTCQHHM